MIVIHDKRQLPDALKNAQSLDGITVIASLYGTPGIAVNLQDAKDGLFALLDRLGNAAALDELKTRLIDGKINGNNYYIGSDNPCGCLYGTLAHSLGVGVETLLGGQGKLYSFKNAEENLFMLIDEGQTPADNPASALVVEWIVEYEARPAQSSK